MSLQRATHSFALFVLFSIGFCLASRQALADQFAYFHENVLGTSFELRIEADSQISSDHAEQMALAEIDRLSEVFSSYSKTSELSRFLDCPLNESVRLSPELSGLLQRSEQWRNLSKGAFNPAVEILTRRWKQAGAENLEPSEGELADLARKIDKSIYAFDSAADSWILNAGLPLSFNAIAKGTIVDLVIAKVLTDAKGVEGILVNIGGDLRVAGTLTQMVDIADPKQDYLGGDTQWQLKLSNSAVATSGISERQLVIGDKAFSHIIDPRTGKPVEHTVSSTVVASDAETADVLATICSVLKPQDAIELIDSLESCECLIVDCDGNEWTSSGWLKLATSKPVARLVAMQEGTASPHQFEIQFEISKSDQGGRYRRPYVAVWVEDADDFPVKTLSLFLMTENPGPRWHRDLRRWYAGDQVRLVVDSSKLIGTVSKPTRNPGEYKISWDGRDDSGALLKDGKYTLYIEAAREHGTYQLMKLPFEIGSKDFSEELKGNVEIKSASMVYKKKS